MFSPRSVLLSVCVCVTARPEPVTPPEEGAGLGWVVATARECHNVCAELKQGHSVQGWFLSAHTHTHLHTLTYTQRYPTQILWT